MVSQPAVRIARSLGLRKGSLGSALIQLYLSFAISCLIHEFQIFMVTRRDMGEFAFFMSQPVAITVESLVQRMFSQVRSRGAGPDNTEPALARYAGYIWVAFWFSISLPSYVKGCRDAGIVHDAIFGSRPFEAGVRVAE
jgi:heme exporter protein D